MPHRGMHSHYLFCFLAMNSMVPLPFGISNANKHHSISDEIHHFQPVFDFSSPAWSNPNCIAMGSIVVVATARLSSSSEPLTPSACRPSCCSDFAPTSSLLPPWHTPFMELLLLIVESWPLHFHFPPVFCPSKIQRLFTIFPDKNRNDNCLLAASDHNETRWNSWILFAYLVLVVCYCCSLSSFSLLSSFICVGNWNIPA